MFIHLERAAADLVSNPTIKVSMGTKMPPPPTPPTVPHADPRSPITVASTVLQLNSNFCTRDYQLRKQNQTPLWHQDSIQLTQRDSQAKLCLWWIGRGRRRYQN